MTRVYDVAIVGAGPNGLTAAAYLARAGADVVVLERRFERGGTFASDDYSTPFLYNQAQLLLPLGAALPPYADLDLRADGVAFIEPALAVEVGGPVIGRGGTGLGCSVEAMFAAASRAVPAVLYASPRPEADVLAGLGADAGGAVELAELTVAKLTDLASSEAGRIALRYACAVAGFVEPDQRLGLIGGFCVARWFSPTLVAGGTKNLANALFRVAVRHGATCQVSARVARIERRPDGFRLVGPGDLDVAARTVVSTLDPYTTFAELVDGGPELTAAAKAWVFDDVAAFTAHYGIKGQPPLGSAAPGPGPLVRIVGFDSCAQVDEHLAAVRAGALPERPAGHLVVTTAHDPTQASPGPFGPLHTLRYDTFAPRLHPSGSWDRPRPAYRAACWAYLCSALPELGAATLLARFADAPGDLRRRFGTARGGTVRQGALLPHQTLDRRPHPSCTSTRTPVDGLYLGGGGVHPGVPGSLGGGYRVARTLCADLGLG